MPRYSMHHFAPALLVLLFLVPALATAGPDHKEGVRSAAEHSKVAPGLLSKIQEFLSVLWAKNGSILDPNGTGTGTSSDDGTSGNHPTSSGDNGSILDPDGHP